MHHYRYLNTIKFQKNQGQKEEEEEKEEETSSELFCSVYKDDSNKLNEKCIFSENTLQLSIIISNNEPKENKKNYI